MSRIMLYAVVFLLCTVLGPLPGWAGSPKSKAVSSGQESAVLFVAHDYGFTGPDRIPAGMTTVQIINQGQDIHHIQLLQLLQGKTVEDFLAAMKADPNHFPAWVKFVGGPNAVLFGSNAVATMNLTEGNYVLVCLIPDKQGVPHVALGMQKPITVRGGKPTVVSAPKAGLTIIQADYVFSMDRPVSAGSQTIHVRNQGTQPHEVVVVKLEAGASAKDWAAAFEPGATAPPPGIPIGGVVGVDQGDHAFFTAHFEPGQYGLLCFFPDPVTGHPHFMSGMMTDFTVR